MSVEGSGSAGRAAASEVAVRLVGRCDDGRTVGSFCSAVVVVQDHIPAVILVAFNGILGKN